MLIPIATGQALQFSAPKVKAFVARHKPRFKSAQELCLVFIVYTVFCRTFHEGTTAAGGDVALVLLLQVLLLLAAKGAAWKYLEALFPAEEDRSLRAMGWYGCVHKVTNVKVVR